MIKGNRRTWTEYRVEKLTRKGLILVCIRRIICVHDDTYIIHILCLKTVDKLPVPFLHFRFRTFLSSIHNFESTAHFSSSVACEWLDGDVPSLVYPVATVFLSKETPLCFSKMFQHVLHHWMGKPIRFLNMTPCFCAIETYFSNLFFTCFFKPWGCAALTPQNPLLPRMIQWCPSHQIRWSVKLQLLKLEINIKPWQFNKNHLHKISSSVCKKQSSKKQKGNIHSQPGAFGLKKYVAPFLKKSQNMWKFRFV